MTEYVEEALPARPNKPYHPRIERPFRYAANVSEHIVTWMPQRELAPKVISVAKRRFA